MPTITPDISDNICRRAAALGIDWQKLSERSELTDGDYLISRETAIRILGGETGTIRKRTQTGIMKALDTTWTALTVPRAIAKADVHSCFLKKRAVQFFRWMSAPVSPRGGRFNFFVERGERYAASNPKSKERKGQ